MKKRIELLALAVCLFTVMYGCVSPNQSSSITSTGVWEPYFTGEEPEWKYNPDEPWAWNHDGESSRNQAPGQQAHQSLYSYLTNCGNYAGRYLNADGYLTVMLVEPTVAQALEITERSDAPVWIIAAKYPYNTLQEASDEAWETITAWISEHPDIPVDIYSSGIDEAENCVEISLQGSGIPQLLSEFDFPECIKFEYKPTVDASKQHDIPREPVTVWQKDGVTIKSTRESYPVGTDLISVTASHTVQNQRLYASYSALSLEKYADGEWYDISGSFVSALLYTEMFDIPAGEEKTVQLGIVTPETLGIGLYRATYHSLVCLSSNGDTTIDNAIVGASLGDNVTFEFTVTQNAEPLPLSEDE